MRTQSMRSLKFALMATSAILLAGCDNSNSQEQHANVADDAGDVGAIYSSMADCQKDYSAEDCQKFQLAAQEAQVKVAPTFPSQNACEATQGGTCVIVHRQTGDVFMPMMMGFMVGHMLAGSTTYVTQPVYYGPPRDCDTRYGNCSGARSIYTGSTYVGRATPTPSGIVRVTPTPSSTYKPGTFATSTTIRSTSVGSGPSVRPSTVPNTPSASPSTTIRSPSVSPPPSVTRAPSVTSSPSVSSFSSFSRGGFGSSAARGGSSSSAGAGG